MNVGFSKKTITPELGVKLAGFDALRISDSILNELYVKVILFEVNQELYGFVSYDLLAIDHLIVEAIKTQLDTKGLISKNIIFCATHTHSGPQGILDTSKGFLKSAIGILGDSNDAYIKKIVDATVEVIEEARSSMSEGSFQLVKDSLQGLGANRNQENFVGDSEVVAIQLKKNDGSKAMLALAACHPTILSFDNTAISGDFISTYSDALKDYDVAMFLNGSCGDISTRFTRKGSGYDEVVRFGNLLSDKVVQMVKNAKEETLNYFNVTPYDIKLKAKQAETIEEAKEKVVQATKNVEDAKTKEMDPTELRLLQSFLEGANANLNYAKAYDGVKEIVVPINIIQMNTEVFISIPGELFSELSNMIKDDSIHFITYANGYLMYFANEYAYDHHFYESYSSPFAKGESEKLIQLVKEKIEERNIWKQ